MTRYEIRQGLTDTPLPEFELLVQQRDVVWISDEAVEILDRLGHTSEFGPFWWREPKGPSERGMIRQLREVLDDVERMGRGIGSPK